jgi:hypothetical protein
MNLYNEFEEMFDFETLENVFIVKISNNGAILSFHSLRKSLKSTIISKVNSGNFVSDVWKFDTWCQEFLLTHSVSWDPTPPWGLRGNLVAICREENWHTFLLYRKHITPPGDVQAIGVEKNICQIIQREDPRYKWFKVPEEYKNQNNKAAKKKEKRKNELFTQRIKNDN